MRTILAMSVVVGLTCGAEAMTKWVTPFAVLGGNDSVRCIITNVDKKAQFVVVEVLDAVGNIITLGGSGYLCPTVSPLNVNFSCFADGSRATVGGITGGSCAFISETSRSEQPLKSRTT